MGVSGGAGGQENNEQCVGDPCQMLDGGVGKIDVKSGCRPDRKDKRSEIEKKERHGAKNTAPKWIRTGRRFRNGR